VDKQPKILIVDDDQANIKMLASALKAEYEILTALNGCDAITLTKEQQPDLILLDIMLPDLDGFEVCKIIKSDNAISEIPIIFLTALDTFDGEFQGLELGGADYLTKPIKLKLLRLRVRNHITLKEHNELIKKQRDLLAIQKEELDQMLTTWVQTFDAVPDLISIIDTTNTITRVNKALADRFGVAPEKMIGLKCYEVIHGESKPPGYCPHVRMMHDGHTCSQEIEEKKLSGLFEISVSPLTNTRGQVTASVHIARDITERKKLEGVLKDSEEQLRSIFEASSDAIGVSCKGTHIIANPAYLKLFGLNDLDELINTPIINLIAPSERERILSYIGQRSESSPVPSFYETIGLCSNGEEFPMEVSVSCYFRAEELYTVVILRDLTERKRVEAAQKTLLEFTPIATIVHRNGYIIYVNKIAIRMFAASSAQEMLGKPFLSLIHQDFHQISFERKELADQGIDLPMIEFKFCKMDETSITAEIRSKMILYEGEQAYISCVLDTSERNKALEDKLVLEQQFQQAQKMESLGVLASGIAHDFNNILAIIMGNCALVKMDPENADNFIAGIEKASERAAGLCRQMLAYAGKAQLDKTSTDICFLVEEMVNLLKATLPQNAEILSDFSSEIPFITADANQLRQVVMNLIINASEAIGEVRGEIRVSLAKITIDENQAVMDHQGKAIPPGKYVRLEVADTGCGMDKDTQRRLFEPFFTTKFSGRGLGMSAVLGIITSHNGALQLYSQPGDGTTFNVYLPASKQTLLGDLSQQVSSAPWRGSGTILLVEDEDQVRLIAKSLLKNIGFTVLEAVNGKEALELYQKKATDITMVVTDMGMPVMDGYELFYELKKLNPELPIIVSSGYGDSEVGSRIGTDNIAGLISKPYTPDKLRDVLKGVVECLPTRK
jgi:PAS domain S-box-containing protein